MNSQFDFQALFNFGTSKPIVVEPSEAQISSDAGLLPFRQLDEQLGLTQQFAGRRRQWHNRRRQHDPPGEGQPCTWRTRLIKVAAYVRQTTRRVIVQLSSNWPYLDHYRQVSQQVLSAGRASFDTS